MTYTTGLRRDRLMPWDSTQPNDPSLSSGISTGVSAQGNNGNVSSYGLTLSGAPSGSWPLFLAWGIESSTITVTSVVQTGATWSRLYRTTNASTGIELWACPAGPTATGITVNLSSAQWTGGVAVELIGAKPGYNDVVARSTYGPQIAPCCGQALLTYARRSGGGGGSFTISGTTGSVTNLINQANQHVGFAPTVARAYNYLGTSNGSELTALWSIPTAG